MTDSAQAFAIWALDQAFSCAMTLGHLDRRLRDMAAVASWAERLGFRDRAEAVFQEIDARIGAIAEEAARQRSNSDLVWGLLHEKDADRAMVFISRLDDPGKELGFIGEMYADQGRLDDALAILERVGLPPHSQLRIRLAVVRAWTANGQATDLEAFLPRVVELVETIEKGSPDRKSVAYSTLARLVAQTGDDKQTISLLRRSMQAAKRSRYELNRGAAIWSWCQALLQTKLPTATKLKLLEAALPAVRRPGSGIHGNPGMTAMAHAYFALGNRDTGLALVRLSTDAHGRVEMLNSFALMLGPSDSPELLDSFMAEAIQHVRGLWADAYNDNRPAMLALVGQTYARAGRDAAALKVFDKAIDWAFSAPTPDGQLAAIVDLLREAPAAPERFWERLEAIERRASEAPAAKFVIAGLSVGLGYVRLRRFDRARDLLKRFSEADLSQSLTGSTVASLIRAARLALEFPSNVH